jgi:hypothetical protein
MEKDLQIVKSEKDGKTYNTLYLKPNKTKKIEGLGYDNFIIVEKLYAEGKQFNGKFGKSYSCAVRFKDQDCSFWLNEKEHDAYKQLGGIGDKIKITCYRHEYSFKNVDSSVPRLRFELA